MFESKRIGFESFAVFASAGCREGGEGASMERVVHGNDLVTTPDGAPFPGELDESFVGFRAAVAEEADSVETVGYQFGCEFRLAFVHEKIRDMDQFLRLLDDRLCNRRMTVTETAHGNAGCKIQILVSVSVPQMTTAAASEENIRFRIRLHDVFIVEFDVFLGQSAVHLPNLLFILLKSYSCFSSK